MTSKNISALSPIPGSQEKCLRHLLDINTNKTLVQSLVSLNLIIVIAFYLGLPSKNLDKLQNLQNMTCRIILKFHKYEHITDHLMSLHWLKVNERITYKIAMLMYKCMNGFAPEYLTKLVGKNHQRTLCSTYRRRLPVISARTSQVFRSTFTAMGPRTWNELPSNYNGAPTIESFKTQLKTHLFRKSYSLL